MIKAAISAPPVASELIAELDGGEVDIKITKMLRELCVAVEETGRKGKVTITLNVRKEGKIAAVGAEIKVTKPVAPTREAVYHFLPDGGLSREDPRQMNLKGLEPTNIKPVS